MANEASSTFRPLMVSEKESPSNGLWSPVMVSKQEAPVQAAVTGTNPTVVVETIPATPQPAAPQVGASRLLNPPIAVLEGASLEMGEPSAVYYDGESPQLNQQRDNYRKQSGFGLSCFRFGRLQFAGDEVVPEKITQLLIMDGSNIDLTRAQFIFKDTYIRVVVLIAGCIIIVPPGVRVIMTGTTILGANDQENLLIPPASGDSQPTLHIHAVSVCGAVSVKTDQAVPWISKLS